MSHLLRIVRLHDQEWHKYVFHFKRHDNAIYDVIKYNIEACRQACVGEWMKTQNAGWMVLYIKEDSDAALFETIAKILDGDKRGKRIWKK